MRKIKIGFADFWNGYIPEKGYFYATLKKYFDVEVIDIHSPTARHEIEYLICSVFSQDFLDFDCIRILYTAENIIPDFNLYDYAIGFEKMEMGDRYFRDPLCYTCIRHDPQLMSNEFLRNIRKEDFTDRKFCAMVVSNGSNADSFRTDFFYNLSKYKTIDSGGGI